MPYEATIEAVGSTLTQVAEEVEPWFDRPAAVRRFRPAGGGWTIDEVLEHITLTNRFLLLTCEKHRGIALRRAVRGDAIPVGESDLSRISDIGKRGSFVWRRPEHMVPKGEVTSDKVRARMCQQWQDCHVILASLCGGVGALCQVTMTVQGIGKIDLYQWLYFLALHARRHVQQMRSIETEYMVSIEEEDT